MKRKNESQNETDTSDTSSDSSESDNDINQSGFEMERKKKAKRKRKRRRKSSGGEGPPEPPRMNKDNGFKGFQPLPGVSTFTEMNRPGPMVIKPEAGRDVEESEEEAAQDLVIVKSEFDQKRPQKSMPQSANNWPGSSGPPQQHIPPSAHQNSYQGQGNSVSVS